MPVDIFARADYPTGVASLLRISVSPRHAIVFCSLIDSSCEFSEPGIPASSGEPFEMVGLRAGTHRGIPRVEC